MKKRLEVLDGPEVPRLGGTLDFMRLLWALDHGLQATSKRMLAELGVTGPQRLALRIVGRYPGISAGRLAKILHVHPSTLTGVLARLEQRRLITRWPDPKDARRALFGLTARGRSLDEERAGTVEAAVGRVLRGIGDEQVSATQETLLILIRALGVDPGGAAVEEGE